MTNAPNAQASDPENAVAAAGPPDLAGQRPLMVIRVATTSFSVRAALVRIRKVLEKAAVPGADLGRLEIVLAEAMNNIVEHAYLDRPDGRIVVRLMREAQSLACEIVDTGTAMPEDTLPTGENPLTSGYSDLPEGGFGWFMIRELADVLRYRRAGGRNYLFIRLELNGDELADGACEAAATEIMDRSAPVGTAGTVGAVSV